MTSPIQRVTPLTPPKNRGRTCLQNLMYNDKYQRNKKVIVPLFLKGDKRGYKNLK
jgi:hypothetical protein